jgi:hypothetical protein
MYKKMAIYLLCSVALNSYSSQKKAFSTDATQEFRQARARAGQGAPNWPPSGYPRGSIAQALHTLTFAREFTGALNRSRLAGTQRTFEHVTNIPMSEQSER